MSELGHSRQCVTLPQACLQTLHGGGQQQWRLQWKNGINRRRAPKQLHLYVAGLPPTALDELLKKRVLPRIREPLMPGQLRHLEHDTSHLPLDGQGGSNESRLLEAASAQAGVPFVWGGNTLTMVWPQWENGFGDVIAHTLLPIAEYAHAGPLASPLAVSGLKYHILARLLRAVAPRACAFERPSPPLLPHCNASCYAAIHVCGLDHKGVKVGGPCQHYHVHTDPADQPLPLAWQDAWGAAATLDRAVGFRAAGESNVTFVPPPPRTSAGQRGSVPPTPLTLRVLLAAREAHRPKGAGDRLIVNQAELLEACSGGSVSVAGGERRLQCRLMPAGLAMAEQSASAHRPRAAASPCRLAVTPRLAALPCRVCIALPPVALPPCPVACVLLRRAAAAAGAPATRRPPALAAPIPASSLMCPCPAPLHSPLATPSAHARQ